MDKERVDVTDSKIPWRHALPGRPAVRAHAKPGRGLGSAIGGRRRTVKFARIIRRNQHPMRVRIYAVDCRPSFTAIGASEKTAHFDGDVNDVWITRVKGDAFGVRLMGWAREGPLLDTGHLAQTRKFRPALSQVVAVI